MDRTRFVTHRGHQLVLVDFKDITDPAEATLAVAQCRAFFDGLVPDRSHLSLVDARGARYNVEIVSSLKQLAAQNKPYVKATAVISLSATHRVAMMSIAMFTKRLFRAFSEPEEAMDWLVSQK